METDGRQGDEGRDGTDPPSNVVQFPGDWFGPKDELVPFGPRADEAARVDVDAPVRPDDFWGEGSAAIQHALRASEVIDGGDLAPAARLPQLRLARLVAGGVALIVCSVALVGRFEGAATRTALRSSARTELGVAGGARAAAPDPRDSTWRQAALFLALRRTPPLRTAVAASRRSHVTRPRSTGAVSSTPTSTAIPAATYVSAPVSENSGPAVHAASAPSGGASGGGSSGGGASASAGPQGPGAPFGPGHLG